jgi:hypothetical protein
VCSVASISAAANFAPAVNPARCVWPPFTGRGSIEFSTPASRRDAAEIGFDDEFIYEQMPLQIATHSLPMQQICSECSLELFQEWAAKPDKVSY